MGLTREYIARQLVLDLATKTNKPFTTAQAKAYATRENGLVTENTVATAIKKLVGQGELVKLVRGLYQRGEDK